MLVMMMMVMLVLMMLMMLMMMLMRATLMFMMMMFVCHNFNIFFSGCKITINKLQLGCKAYFFIPLLCFFLLFY